MLHNFCVERLSKKNLKQLGQQQQSKSYPKVEKTDENKCLEHICIFTIECDTLFASFEGNVSIIISFVQKSLILPIDAKQKNRKY